MARDAWLYDKHRVPVRKDAIKRKGLYDASSDVAFRMLVEDPRQRARIVDWGGQDQDSRVDVIKRGRTDEPAPSRQLRDPFTTFYVQGIALEPPLPPDRLLNLTEENALHAACLMAKAVDACGRGWEFEPREGEENDKSLIQSDLPEKLKAAVKDLTPELSFTELLYQAAWEMDAIGWSVWEVVRAEGHDVPGTHGKIDSIYPIPSHTIRASLDPRKWVQIRAGRVRYFKKFGAPCTINNETGEVHEWRGAGKEAAAALAPDYVASELIIFKYYTPRSLWYGLPRWVSAIATIAELTAIREFNVSWFASGGQTDYHMHFKADSIETSQKMRDQVREQMRENAGRSHVNLLTFGDANTDVVVSKLGEILREGHFRFRRGDLAKEVLIVHNVPPYRIGWAETGALAGSPAEVMLDAYKFGAIKPIQVIIQDRLEHTLFNPDLGGVKTDEFRLRLHDIELDDVSSELEVAKTGVQLGFMTPNQARAHVGLDPDEERPVMNEYYYNGAPLGQASPQPGGASGEQSGEQPGEEQPDERAQQEALAQAGGRPGRKPGTSQGEDTAKAAAAAAAEAKRIVVSLLGDYEEKLKAALADSDPIDSEQPPARRPRRGRGRPGIVQPAGPARDDKPNVA
jgi:hypothetical protein